MEKDSYRTTEKYVLFQESFLSNWYPCKITYKEYEFSSSEQLYMYFKAQYFEDIKMMGEIINCESPKAAKEFGKMIKNFNDEEWMLVCDEYMYLAVKNKFKQNPELKNLLIDLGNSKNFVEGSLYDDTWGVGLDWESIEIENSNNWRGQNAFGKVLDRVRLDLIEKDLF